MELTTKRLILREFVPEDWQPVLAYQSQPQYLLYYPAARRTAQDAQNFVNTFIWRQDERPRLKFQLAITLKETGLLIGNCGIRMDYASAPRADIGYELNHTCWGKGYATEAARAIIAFGFTHLKLHRIWADCIAENVASARVLQKVGMQQEGHLRETQYFKGRWWDTRVFAILRQEWQAITEE